MPREPQALVDRFQRYPEHAWWPLEDLVLEQLGESE